MNEERKHIEFERVADVKRLAFIITALQEKAPTGSEVLDVGCGNGIITRALGKKGFTITGIDVSEKAITKAKALNTLPNVQFKVMSAEQLVADGRKYHAIICSEVLEHLNQPSLLLQTLHQILDNNGILIVTVPNGKGPRELLVTRPIIAMQKKNNWLWRLVQGIKKVFGYSGSTVQSDADDLTHIQFFTTTSLKSLAAKNKFSIIQFGKTNFIDDVFPVSIIARKSKLLQKADSWLADRLPYQFNGGFFTVWVKQ